MTTITTEDYMFAQLGRMTEIASMYVMHGLHDLEDIDAGDERLAAMKKMLTEVIDYNDTSPSDVSALTAAKLLTSFYGFLRIAIDPELVDALWIGYLELQAAHRADYLAARDAETLP